MTENNESLKEQIIKQVGQQSINNYVIPTYIEDNISHELRDYQKEALAIFNAYMQNNFPFKEKPMQLLFNMATGSGKTLVMASLILELYNAGYRNFIFFVNSTNIITKTLDNFLHGESNKCLFNKQIFIDGKQVNIKQVNNFTSNNGNDINIIFTTIHSLHSNIKEENESNFGLDELEKYKIVMLADEAHHLSGVTKKSSKQLPLLQQSWEDTINKIVSPNFPENILLEFSATIDFDNPDILKKYKNRTIYEYGLTQFYSAGYSKDINLLQVGLEEELEIIDAKLINTNNNLMLVAILINLYREQIAINNNIRPFKPVILFKAQNTIQQSYENYTAFNNLIANLQIEQLEKVIHIMENTSNINDLANENHILPKSVKYLKQQFNTLQLLSILQDKFKIDNIININDEYNEKNQKNTALSKKEDKKLSEKNNKLINSLELPENNIRVIFAVNKLNEGWDVLNLYDIVRLYNTRDSSYKEGLSPGKTTMQEAQLIGRGARYYPFLLGEQNDFHDKYMRKFDGDIENELRILETMYYFSCKNVKYISELKEALSKIGVTEANQPKVTKTINIKQEILNNPIFAKAEVYVNKRMQSIQSKRILDLFTTDVTENQDYKWIKDFVFNKDNDVSKEHNLMDKNNENVQENNPEIIPMNLEGFDDNIMQNVLLNFNADFNSPEFLEKIKNENIKINFQGNTREITREHQYQALLTYFSKLKKTVGNNSAGSTHFYNAKLKDVLKYPKTVRLPKENADKFFKKNNDSFFIYDNLYVDTSLEIDLYNQFKGFYETTLTNEYEEVVLIRNHLEICFYTFKEGAKFYPDFILILQSKEGEVKTYQVILEAKGEQLSTNDNSKVKASFLQDLQALQDIQDINKKNKSKNKGITFNNKSPKEIKIIGMDFFIEKNNAYFDSLEKKLNLK